MAKKNEPVIVVKNLTKDYGDNRGIFDISFEVPKGCVFGYCGTNGSGKTTTLRNIMGFIRPDKGEVYVDGLEAWKDSEEIKEIVGYVPGEIAFPDVASGSDFLKIQASLTGLKDMKRADYLINKLQLDPTANLKRMSKGMKQKTALVCAMMGEPDILILDEPTTGLDPLMRAAFVDVILQEKAKGKTILMSSHMFEEMEDTCDYVGLIKDGKLLEVVDMDKTIKNRPTRLYKVEFATKEDYLSFKEKKYKIVRDKQDINQLTLEVDITQTDQFLLDLDKVKIKYISEKKYTLENYFLEKFSETEGGK